MSGNFRGAEGRERTEAAYGRKAARERPEAFKCFVAV
jgi:hypothetical protein